LDALIQLSENVPLFSSSVVRYLVQTILPEGDPAGSKLIGGFYEKRFMYFGALVGEYYLKLYILSLFILSNYKTDARTVIGAKIHPNAYIREKRHLRRREGETTSSIERKEAGKSCKCLGLASNLPKEVAIATPGLAISHDYLQAHIHKTAANMDQSPL
jgi:hypothetical protein